MSLLQKKDSAFAPLINLLPQWITPNHLTVARMLLALPLLWFLTHNNYINAFVIMIIAALLDMGDGTLARLRKKTSDTGAILDPIADKLLFGIFLVTAGFSSIPMKLLITIIVLEIIIVLGSIIYPLFMKSYYDFTTRIQANIFGQYKFFFYTIAILLFLITEHHRWIGFFANMCFGIGALCSIISMLYYIRTLKSA